MPMTMVYNPRTRASMPGKPTNAGYAQTTLASGKGEGFVQPEFLGPSRKADATCIPRHPTRGQARRVKAMRFMAQGLGTENRQLDV